LYKLALMSDNFGNTRTKIAQYFYNRIQKNVKQAKIDDFVFDNVKSIGIIFDDNNIGINEFIETISKEFRNKSGVISIFVLAYNVSEENKLEPSGIPIIYFTNKDLNWYGKPKFKDVINYLETPFDLLINLACNSAWPIKFSTALSTSKFKVGRFEENNDVYDFMVDTRNNSDIKKLYAMILEYLRIFNK